MKYFIYLITALLLVNCTSSKSVFNSGSLQQNEYAVVVPFNYDYNIALINVLINDKPYKFLVDTGAPTVISKAIFKDLNIKPALEINIIDSQGQKNKQDLVYVPEIKIGALTYRKIGAVVADLRDVFEFDCMGIDGIIGANQMAKSYWKFDYPSKEITVAHSLETFNLKQFTDTIPFTVSAQQTPYVKGTVNGYPAKFTYDTGFAGFMDVAKGMDTFDNASGFTSFGSSSVGLYGTVEAVTTRSIKADHIDLGSVRMTAQIVDLDDSGLLGNTFMKNYETILDWQSQRIYLKKMSDVDESFKTSFGFSYRFKENKLTVTGLIKELPIDLQIGDELLQINELDFRNLESSTVCERFDTFTLKDMNTITVIYKRDGAESSTVLTRKTLIE